MRLASLARKIKIPPTKLSDYLIGEQIELLQGSNTKLTEDQVQLALEYFDAELPSEVPEPEIEEKLEPKQEEEPKAELELEPEIEEVLPPTSDETELEILKEAVVEETVGALEEPVVEKIENEPAIEIESPVEVIEDVPQQELTYQDYVSREPENEEELTLSEKAATDDSIKVIKPPKVKLQGLTVKGKIDLPEPKIKEPEENKEEEKPKEEKPYDPDEIIYTNGPDRHEQRRKPRRDGNRKKRDSNYNPVEAERKRKARLEKEEKERQLNAQKKAKSNHYKKNVAQKQPSHKIPSQTTTETELIPETKPKVEQKSKNVFGKVWKWMNT